MPLVSRTNREITVMAASAWTSITEHYNATDQTAGFSYHAPHPKLTGQHERDPTRVVTRTSNDTKIHRDSKERRGGIILMCHNNHIRLNTTLVLSNGPSNLPDTTVNLRSDFHTLSHPGSSVYLPLSIHGPNIFIAIVRHCSSLLGQALISPTYYLGWTSRRTRFDSCTHYH
jgi:hypothetical protein